MILTAPAGRVNQLIVRITDLIIELLVVKPLMNAVAPAGGGGILGGLFVGFLPTVAR